MLSSPSLICEGIKQFRSQTQILYDETKQTLGIQLHPFSTAPSIKELGVLPELFPEWLGDRSFQETHSVRFPYICGEMANGIASAQMVIAAAQAGLLAFFGSAGLSLERIRQEIDKIQKALSPRYTWGSNLIHSPHEPHLEQQIVDLYLQKQVTRVSASAFMTYSLPLVHYACKGLTLKDDRVKRQNFLFGKVSRPETARLFMLPAPKSILDQLLREGKITETEAKIGSSIPLSEDITIEADSGGHTDNQVLTSVFSTVLELRNKIQREFAYKTPIRIGAAGGIGSPSGAAAAFAMGAAYILTGSINQGCVESGLDISAKKMLESVQFGDTMMCAASDMFEQGVKLQVLKRGTMYGVRANWLYELYKHYPSLEALPQAFTQRLEKEIFRMSIKDVWEETKNFWKQRDPSQLLKAQDDAKHTMALIFRYYLGLSSKWAIQGIKERQFDFQIWCGPAQAAFNHWIQDSFLAKYENRTVSQVAYNILEGACQLTRAHQLRSCGIPVPSESFSYKPRKIVYENIQNEPAYV
jgi:PfaD family protein